MKTHFLIGTVIVAFVVAVPCSYAAQQQAQPAGPEKLDPIAIVNIRSFNRVSDDFQKMFQMAERSDIFDDLFSKANKEMFDFDGLDRERPLGLMVGMQSYVPPMPFVIGYLPIKNQSALLGTIEKLLKKTSAQNATLSRVAGQNGRYTLGTPEKIILHFVIESNYLYYSNNEDAVTLDLPDPQEITQSLTNNYDFAAQLNLATVPAGTRDIFLAFLRTSVEGQLQQRDNEAKSAYLVRRASGLNALDFLEKTLKQGHSLLFGLKASHELGQLQAELVLKARDKSDLGAEFRGLGRQPSFFQGMLQDDGLVNIASTWKLNAQEKDRLGDIYQALQEALRAQDQLEEDGNKPAKIGSGKIAQVEYLKALKATIEDGYLDYFAKAVANENGSVHLVLAVKVMQGRDLAGDLTQLMKVLQGRSSGISGAPEIALNKEVHQGISFHQLTLQMPTAPAAIPEVNSDDDREKRRAARRLRFQQRQAERREKMFSSQPSLYLGVSPNVLWICFGGEHTFSSMKTIIDQLKASRSIVQKSPPRAPFQLSVRMDQFINMGDRIPEWLQALAKENLQPERDVLRFQIKPSNESLKLQVLLEPGMIELIAQLIAREYDKTQL